MKEEYFVDSENKVILSCPDCGNQFALHLIRGYDIVDGLQSIWCEACKKPYVASVHCELKTKIQIWKCYENPELLSPAKTGEGGE